MSDPRITTVICTRNRAGYLGLAIDSLLTQALPATAYEIVVVDNGSTDSTREVVRRYGTAVAYVHEPRTGLAHARNTGWRHARGEFVAFLDDDAIASPAWLETILHVFETVTPTPGCVGGRVLPIWEAPPPAWLSAPLMLALTVVDWSDVPHPITDLSREWLAGANFAFPVAVLEEVGGFIAGLDRIGNRLLSSGDIYIERQILARGRSCFFHPRAAVRHHVPADRLTRTWFVRRYYWQGVSDAIMERLAGSPTVAGRYHQASRELLGLLAAPSRLAWLVWPTSDPARFRRRCHVALRLGRIRGLLARATG